MASCTLNDTVGSSGDLRHVEKRELEHVRRATIKADSILEIIKLLRF